jgi:hypothetical protein
VQSGESVEYDFCAYIEKYEDEAPKSWNDHFKVKACSGPKAKRTTWIGVYRIIPKIEDEQHNLQQMTTIYDWPEFENTNQKIKDIVGTVLTVYVFSGKFKKNKNSYFLKLLHGTAVWNQKKLCSTLKR